MRVNAVAWDAHCTMPGCGWSSGGVARTQLQADRRAQDALKDHLHHKHAIDEPRMKRV